MKPEHVLVRINVWKENKAVPLSYINEISLHKNALLNCLLDTTGHNFGSLC